MTNNQTRAIISCGSEETTTEEEEWLDFGKLIKQISEELRKNANNALRGKDITLSQMDTLSELYQTPDGRCTLKELEQKLHVAQSTAAGLVGRLKQKGLVETFSHPDDKRAKIVKITPAGISVMQAASHDRAASEKKFLSCLTSAEQEIFFVLLKKVRDTLI